MVALIFQKSKTHLRIPGIGRWHDVIPILRPQKYQALHLVTTVTWRLGFVHPCCKANFTLEEVMKAQRGSRGIALLFLYLQRWIGWVINVRPRWLYPRERPSTLCIEGRAGIRVRLDGCEKSRPTQGFDPRAVQPVTSHYADWAIPAGGKIINN